MVVVFTDTGCGESIAYSTDRGRSWQYYEGNPVIRHSGRDPKLVWYEPGKHWVIALFDERFAPTAATSASTPART